MRTGIANVPLHGGHCPPWLFEKMKLLAAMMTKVIVMEYGTAEMLRRLSDPVWFQSFGSVLGFDWHSSGLTTVVCGALKEGLSEHQGELGLFFAGGKGRVSRKTPLEIIQAGDRYGLDNDLQQLQGTSRLVAKVDSAAVQDGYQLYHHFFVFDRTGNWAVVQQGMNEANHFARRYHWLSESVKSFVEDPHQAVCGKPQAGVLNLVAGTNYATRRASVQLCEEPQQVLNIIERIAHASGTNGAPKQRQISLFEPIMEEPAGALGTAVESGQTVVKKMDMPAAHPIPTPQRINKILYQLYEKPPESYEKLLETQGVGPGTLRALAMVAEVTHGARPSYEDPVRYAFAHGGKDGFPFPVDRNDITHSFEVLRTAVEKAAIGQNDKLEALRRLARQEDKAVQGEHANAAAQG